MTTAAKLDPVFASIENAPMAGPDDFTPEALAHLARVQAEPIGHGVTHAEIEKMLAERAKREG